jgi:hypothetical protein
MHSVMRIEIAAPREAIYAVASDLEAWPTFLSHYRFNRFLVKAPSPTDGGIVQMSAMRAAGLPLTWVSVYRRDPQALQMHFEHLKPLTRGMIVRWDFLSIPGGTRVEIVHDFILRWPLIGKFLAEKVIGAFLVDHVAGLTLRGLKAKMEGAGAQ